MLKEAIEYTPKLDEAEDSKQVASQNSSVAWSTVVSHSRKKEQSESTVSKCPPQLTPLLLIQKCKGQLHWLGKCGECSELHVPQPLR